MLPRRLPMMMQGSILDRCPGRARPSYLHRWVCQHENNWLMSHVRCIQDYYSYTSISRFSFFFPSWSWNFSKFVDTSYMRHLPNNWSSFPIKLIWELANKGVCLNYLWKLKLASIWCLGGGGEVLDIMLLPSYKTLAATFSSSWHEVRGRGEG